MILKRPPNPGWLTCAVLCQVGYAITKIPEDFTLHKGVKRVYEQRRQMIESGEGVDWGTAEALAFGTLLSEGMHPASTSHSDYIDELH